MTSALIAPKQAAEELAKRLDAAHGRFMQLLGNESQANRVTAIIQNVFARDQYIRECTPTSIVQTAVQCVELGLDPAPQLGQFFFIPRNVKVRTGKGEKWEKRACGQVGYRGWLAKAYRCPRILSIDVELVHANDRFELHRGTHPDVLHEYLPAKDRGPIKCGYFAARLGPADAAVPVWKVADMPIEEIEGIRDRSDSYRKWKNAKANGKQWKEPPWVTDFAEMARKTLIVRGLKLCPVDDQLRALLDVDDDFRGARAAVAETGARTRGDDLKEKLGVTPTDAVDAEVEEEEIEDDASGQHGVPPGT